MTDRLADNREDARAALVSELLADVDALNLPAVKVLADVARGLALDARWRRGNASIVAIGGDGR